MRARTAWRNEGGMVIRAKSRRSGLGPLKSESCRAASRPELVIQLEGSLARKLPKTQLAITSEPARQRRKGRSA